MDIFGEGGGEEEKEAARMIKKYSCGKKRKIQCALAPRKNNKETYMQRLSNMLNGSGRQC
jgi:hypothetical protein